MSTKTRHCHVAGQGDIDQCGACGLDLRNPIHFRVNAEADQRAAAEFAATSPRGETDARASTEGGADA